MIRKLIFFILFFNFIFSQALELKVLGIDVQGNKGLSKKDVMRNARLYDGITIRGDEVQNGIKRLWKLNRFSDVQIFITEEREEGVYLLINVVELPVLDQYTFSGNKKSVRTLKEEIQLESGQILSDLNIFEASQDLRKYYISKHYHNISIETVLTEGSAPNSQNLEFVITEGKKLKIRDIIIDGNESVSDFWVNRQLKDSKPWHWYTPWRGKWDSEKFEDDKNNLINYYRNKGYRDFHIMGESLELTENGKGLQIVLNVSEGPLYYFRNFTWQGNNLHDDIELQHRLGIASGDLFNDLEFQMAVSEQVSPLYMDKGYFYFQITPQILPVGIDSLDVNFLIIENDIVKVRKILISGNEKTDENVIRRELMVFPGDIFSRKKLLDSYRDIFMLNFFNNVVPNVAPVDKDEIDITLDVTEKSTGQANFSMGYNQIHGFTGGGGFQFPNFRGKGQTLSISYNRGLSGQSNSANSSMGYNPYSNSTGASSFQSFSLGFTEPWLFDTPNLVGVSFFYTERGIGSGNYLPFDTKQVGGSTRWGRRFKWPDPFFRGSWMVKAANNTYYSNSKSDLTGYFTDAISDLINVENDRYAFQTSGVSFTQVITRDNRDHPEFPTKGSKLNWTSTFSGSFLGGDEDYHKHVFDIKWFTPLMRKFVMHQGIKLGVLKQIPVEKGKRSIVPPSARFMMGGSGIPYGEMLRGYDDNSVGPIGYYNRGGTITLKYSLEFRVSLSENPTIYALAFAEAGNVWADFEMVDPFDLKRSAGVGIRLFMPMLGMLGYDMGYGLDNTSIEPDAGPHGWDYHLIFGMPF